MGMGYGQMDYSASSQYGVPVSLTDVVLYVCGARSVGGLPAVGLCTYDDFCRLLRRCAVSGGCFGCRLLTLVLPGGFGVIHGFGVVPHLPRSHLSYTLATALCSCVCACVKCMFMRVLWASWSADVDISLARLLRILALWCQRHPLIGSQEPPAVMH